MITYFEEPYQTIPSGGEFYVRDGAGVLVEYGTRVRCTLHARAAVPDYQTTSLELVAARCVPISGQVAGGHWKLCVRLSLLLHPGAFSSSLPVPCHYPSPCFYFFCLFSNHLIIFSLWNNFGHNECLARLFRHHRPI